MKAIFTPLEPKPVRVADMPDGVAYEVLGWLAGDILIWINKDDYTWTVDAEGKPTHRMLPISECSERKVLRRRDGKPLPSGEPVPLDTLEPLPVWYRSAKSNYYYSHDGAGGYAYYSDSVGLGSSGKGSNGKLVYPEPYTIEVKR